MSNVDDSDYLLAIELQKQFDKEIIDLSSDDDDVVQNDFKLALKLQQDDEEEGADLDDSDVVEQKPSVSTTNRSAHVRSTPDTDVVVYDPKRLNVNTFYIEELNTYIDRQYNQDWQFHKMTPKIDAVFERFNTRFFNNKLTSVLVKWRRTMGECTNKNIIDNDGCYTIWLNETVLRVRPRIDLVSVLLHEMIHAYLKLSGIKEPTEGHDDNFVAIMLFFNKTFKTNIKTTHQYTDNEDQYKRQFWRCQGICSNYTPFYGIVHSAETPGCQCEWWINHQIKCGGTFYRIFEAINKVDGVIQYEYVTSCHYMEPKSIGKIRINRKAKESIDLTDESPTITTNVETVTLDDTQPNPTNTVIAKKFIENMNLSLGFNDQYHILCPICEEQVKTKLFCNHMDGCRGFVVEIPFRVKRTMSNRMAMPSTSSKRPKFNGNRRAN